MITPENFEQLITILNNYKQNPENLSDEDAKIATTFLYVLNESSKKKLDEFKQICLNRNLTWESLEFGIKGYPGYGNDKNVVNVIELFKKLGQDDFLKVASVSKASVEETFGKKSEQNKKLSEVTNNVSSTDTIFKLQKLKG